MVVITEKFLENYKNREKERDLRRNQLEKINPTNIAEQSFNFTDVDNFDHNNPISHTNIQTKQSCKLIWLT